jgi:hypothetical protein
METTPQEITKLFVELVAPASSLPFLRLTPVDVQHLQRYPLPVILKSFKSTSKWVGKKRTEGISINRTAIIKSIKESCVYNGNLMKMKPVHVGPSEKELEVLDLRELFQDTVGNDEWTLTSEEIQELLRAHTAPELRLAFEDLAMWVRTQDPLPSQQAIVDQLYFSLADFKPSTSVLAVR